MDDSCTREGYYRKVTVLAAPKQNDCETDFESRLFARIDVDERDPYLTLPLIGGIGGRTVPDAEKQVVKAAEPVVEELNTVYQHASMEPDIDLDAVLDSLRDDLPDADELNQNPPEQD